MTRTCVVDGCRRSAAARGLCTGHLGLSAAPGNRVTRTGVVLGPAYRVEAPRTRVAKRRSDGMWGVAIGGRPPALVYATWADAIAVATTGHPPRKNEVAA